MINKKAEVKVEFKDLTKKQMKHLFKAEKELGKAGVHCDTGYDFGCKKRVWEFITIQQRNPLPNTEWRFLWPQFLR